MTIRHIHPFDQKPDAKAEAMARLSRQCLASLLQFRQRQRGKDFL